MKTYDPGHDGWYAVTPRDHRLMTFEKRTVFYCKATSAYSAAARAGFNLTEAAAIPITDCELVAKLELAGTLDDMTHDLSTRRPYPLGMTPRRKN